MKTVELMMNLIYYDNEFSSFFLFCLNYIGSINGMNQIGGNLVMENRE